MLRMPASRLKIIIAYIKSFKIIELIGKKKINVMNDTFDKVGAFTFSIKKFKIQSIV